MSNLQNTNNRERKPLFDLGLYPAKSAIGVERLFTIIFKYEIY